MKKIILLGMGTLLASGAFAQTIEERVEALEFQGYENIFKFSGQLEMRYDSLSTKIDDDGADGLAANLAPAVDDSYSKSFWRNFARINFAATPNDKLSVFGRLSASFYSNKQSEYSGLNLATSLSEGGVAGGSRSTEAYFERFFVNYRFTQDFTFTFGRLPTANGTPYHLERNESQAGVYPVFAYNSLLDGVAGTYKLNPEWNLKFVYTPFTFLNEGSSTAKSYRNATNDAGEEINTTQSAFAFITEYEKGKTALARRTHVTLTYFKLNELALNVKDDVTSKQTDVELGLTRLVLAAELSGVSGSKFDLAFQYILEEVESDGLYGPSSALSSIQLGYLTDEDGDTNSGTSLLLTLRYATTATSKVGIQYFQASEYSFPTDGNTKHAFSMYKVPGSGYHLFYNKAFEGGLSMNIGYATHNQTHEATASGVFGPTRKVNNVRQDIYTSFIANF